MRSGSAADDRRTQSLAAIAGQPRQLHCDLGGGKSTGGQKADAARGKVLAGAIHRVQHLLRGADRQYPHWSAALPTLLPAEVRNGSEPVAKCLKKSQSNVLQGIALDPR